MVHRFHLEILYKEILLPIDYGHCLGYKLLDLYIYTILLMAI
jgi:hypothetical protein